MYVYLGPSVMSPAFSSLPPRWAKITVCLSRPLDYIITSYYRLSDSISMASLSRTSSWRVLWTPTQLQNSFLSASFGEARISISTRTGAGRLGQFWYCSWTVRPLPSRSECQYSPTLFPSPPLCSQVGTHTVLSVLSGFTMRTMGWVKGR